MRFLSGVSGAVAGTVTGGVLTLALVSWAFGSVFAAGFSLFLTLPIGLLAGLIVGVVSALRAFDFLRRPDADGALQMGKRRVRAALVLGPLLAIGISVYNLYRAGIPPDDAVMLAHFALYRKQFDELALMTRHDKKLWSVDNGGTNPSDTADAGISPARVTLYEEKLQAAGVQGFERSGDGNGIDFLFWSDGAGSKKDFAYLFTPPPSVLRTLDGGGSLNSEWQVLFRSLSGPWYLRYEIERPRPTGDATEN